MTGELRNEIAGTLNATTKAMEARPRGQLHISVTRFGRIFPVKTGR